MSARFALGSALALLAVLAAAPSVGAAGCFEVRADERPAGDNRFRPVEMLRLRLRESRTAPTNAWAVFRGSDDVWTGTLDCWAPAPGTPEGAWQCAASCNGGAFTAWQQGGALILDTRGGFLVGNACSGGEAARRVTDRYEVTTRFRMRSVDPERCRAQN